MGLLRLQIDYWIFWVLQTAGKLEHGRGSVNAGRQAAARMVFRDIS